MTDPGRPRVSIVIVTHDARAELERCLGSIARHAGVPAEAIVVDNASTDETVEWVRREHPQARVVELERNVGVAAREDGLAVARGDLVMFLDSDAALTEGALPRMVAAMDEHADWGLVGPRLVHDDGSLQLSCRRYPPALLPLLNRRPLNIWFEDSAPVRHHMMADDAHDRTRPVLWVLGACQLFRASLGRRAGTFSDYFLGPDDTDWCIRIRDAGGEIVYFPEATVIHSSRRTSRRKPLSRATVEQLKGWVRFQWEYRHRRRELIQLAEELDRADLDRRP